MILDLLYLIGSVLLVLAAVPSTYVVWKYHRSLPWTQSEVGRTWMLKAIGLAAVLDLAVLRIFIPESVTFSAIRVIVFGFVVYAMWRQAFLIRTIITTATTVNPLVDGSFGVEGAPDPSSETR